MMPEDREVLKAVFQSSPECPTLDELLNAGKTGDPALGKRLEDCPHCAGEAALYQQFITEVPPGELDEKILRRINSRLPTAAGPPWKPLKSWMENLWRPAVYGPAIVAFAGLLIVAGLNLRQRDPLQSGLPMENVERGQAVELLAPKGDLANAPAVLSWKTLPAAFLYRVKLMEVDRHVIWETESKVAHVALPPAIQNKALPGKRLIWSVEAFGVKGESLGTGTQDFRRAVAQPVKGN